MKYHIYSSINNPGLFEVHDQKGSVRMGFEPYVIIGTKEKCEEFLKKWNK